MAEREMGVKGAEFDSAPFFVGFVGRIPMEVTIRPIVRRLP